MLDIVTGCNLVQYQRKLMMQPWEYGKNPNSGPNLGHPRFFSLFFSWVVIRQCSKLSYYAISRNTNEPNLKKWQKKLIWARFWPTWPKFGPQKFLCRFYLYQMLYIVASYHRMPFHGKLMNQTRENWKNLVLGQILTLWPKFRPHRFFCGFYLY